MTLKMYLPAELLAKCQHEKCSFVLNVEQHENDKLLVNSYRRVVVDNTILCGDYSQLFVILDTNSSSEMEINKNFDFKITISTQAALNVEWNETVVGNEFKKCLFLIYKNKQYDLVKGANAKLLSSTSDELTEKIAMKIQQFENYNKIFQYAFKNSALLSNFVNTILLLVYAFQSSNRLKYISRYTSCIINLLIGIALFVFLYNDNEIRVHEQLNRLCSNIFEYLVEWLTQIIYWLMGVPAGLKLNKQLNEFFGRFFLYHIYLWNASIDLFNEILPTLTLLIMYTPVIGISFQLALISDAFNLLTIHAQCFYGYARAIYKLEIDSLKSLFRLFRGKKFNPMRKRIDSYMYDIDQLFIGTFGLCIAFFLLPTILIYYVVFLSLQMLILSVNYMFKNLINFMNNIPIYEIFLNCVNSIKIQKHVHYEIDTHLSSDTIAVCHITVGWLNFIHSILLKAKLNQFKFKKMSFNELLQQTECKFFKLNLPSIKQVVLNILSGREINKSMSM